MSGLQADARSMIEHARVESQNHAFHYNEQLSVESCTQAICDLALRFGEGAQGEESIMSRPFGVALLVAGWDEDDGPQLSVRIEDTRDGADDYIDITLSLRGHSTDTTQKLSDLVAKEHRRSYNLSTTDH
jgi:Proteasome subunit